MSISATVGNLIGYVRTVEGDFVSDSDATYTVNGMDGSAVIDADTVPPATDGTEFELAMTSGAVTIDLTALLEDDGVGTWTALGLKVQGVTFRNPSTNANNISVTEGASSGHPLLGTAFLFELKPGQSLTLLNEGVDVGTDVASGDKTWDVTGTGAQVIQIGLIVG